ncbi:MAG: SH3 domain-containing protein [Clostridiaceae bacterium]|nr:SH3 domain-containing protein [Clostridiaceae bacterium]
MIRSTLTAHLAERDRKELTLQLNDRDIGLLATHRQQHYVASGNRRVQLIAGILTDKDDPAAIHDTRVQLRQWQLAFRDLQIQGLSRFLEAGINDGLEADFLFLMTAEIVFVFCNKDLGVYLHRGERIYRQQPTLLPQLNLSESIRKLDFYAFRPRENDNFLIIDPEFIDLFMAEELEELFGDMRQLNVSMAELSSIASQSGYSNDTTWFSVHVQRIDTGQMSGSKNTSLGGSEYDHSGFLQSIRRSKVVPLRDGNVRILPAELELERQVRYFEESQAQAPKFISSFGNEKPRLQNKRTGDQRQYPSAARTQEENPPEPKVIDRIKMWNAGGIKDVFNRLFYRATHLFEHSRSLSLLTYIAIVLLLLLLLVWGIKSIGSGRGGEEETKSPDSTVEESSTIDPDATIFEIEVEVRANSLQVMTSPAGTDLIATLQRGDKVFQTSQAEEGWVRVRLADGRQGYVLEQLLFPEE